MSKTKKHKYVSRAGEKLEFAIKEFNLKLEGLSCADFGCSTGGFTDCMLAYGATKVFSVDTGYGVLDWKLRSDKRVFTLERENAMYIKLPEKVDFLTIDVSWTRLDKVIKNAFENLKDNGQIVALIKPHYEAQKEMLINGRIEENDLEKVISEVKGRLNKLGYKITRIARSPILGEKGQNVEYLSIIEKNV